MSNRSSSDRHRSRTKSMSSFKTISRPTTSSTSRTKSRSSFRTTTSRTSSRKKSSYDIKLKSDNDSLSNIDVSNPEVLKTKFDKVNKLLEASLENEKHLENVLPSKFIQRDASCIRKYSNFSYPKNYGMFYNFIDYTPSKKVLNENNIKNSAALSNYLNNLRSPEMYADFMDTLKMVSPKILSLLEKINSLDKKDMEQYGNKFKHFIFSDSKSGMGGVKLLASALLANGMKCGYTANPIYNGKKGWSKMELLSNNELEKSKYNNFYMLCSKTVYDEPINVATKKDILSRFNERPDNIYGENVRIILMDGGYKEGIDLFDIKYVHIFEPTITQADQTQVIGRGTRTCGQKGLDFHPIKGWPLYVYIYDLKIEDPFDKSLDATSGIEMYFKARNLNIKLLNFLNELETTCIQSAVDAELNKNIHSFSISSVEENDSSRGVSNSTTSSRNDSFFNSGSTPKSSDFIIQKPLNAIQMRQYIRDYFSKYAWGPVVMENNCIPKKQSGGATIMNYTPTQAFVSNFFTPINPLKGMLLWHSVGTGKTCTAIATATSSFEKQGYTILWVTRTTLKNDIWKNMFDQVCHEIIKLKVENGVVIPSKNADRMKLLSKSWKIRPMSYKQFSNLVSKKNKSYETIVNINGNEDPLRKTLLVIDEAHKLYGGGDLSSLETPDMVALHAALMNSYMVSGADSVKLLLMTATPIQTDPMELIKLLNLFKLPDAQIPDQFDIFSEKYLDSKGFFKPSGLNQFRDEIAGHISYLNREKDARQFSQPIVSIVKTDIYDKNLLKFNKSATRKVYFTLKNNITAEMKRLKSNPILKATTPDGFDKLKSMCDEYELPKAKAACKKVVSRHKKDASLKLRLQKSQAKDLLKEYKIYANEVKELIHDNIEDALHNEKHSPLMFRSGENEVELTNISSVYDRLSTKCSKSAKDSKNIVQSAIENNAKIAELKRKVDAYEESISEKKQVLKKEKNILTKAALRDKITKDSKLLKKNAHTLKKKVQNYTKHVKKVLKQTKKNITASKKRRKRIIRSMKNLKIYNPDMEDKDFEKTILDEIKNTIEPIENKQREKEELKRAKAMKQQEKKEAAVKKKEDATRKKREREETIANKKEEATRKKREREETIAKKKEEATRKKK